MTEHLLGTLAVVGPIAGLAIGAAVGASRKQVVACAAKGYLIGCVGLVFYMSWTVGEWKAHYERYVRTPVSWKTDQPNDMRELISAETAERAINIAVRIIFCTTMAGIVVSSGLRRIRIVMVFAYAAVTAPVIVGLWSAYNWHCRYDPVTDYFGLEKVRVLGVNFAMFIATGVAMGILWALMTAKHGRGSMVNGPTTAPAAQSTIDHQPSTIDH